MTNLALIFAASLLLLGFAVYAAWKQRRQLKSLEDFQAQWQPIDVEAFANLLDPSEERFLQEKLSSSEFRKIRRRRLLVIWEYVGRISANTRLMVQAGQIIQHHNSGMEAIRARHHVQDAMRLRHLVFAAQLSLVVKFALPGMETPLQTMLQKYGDIAHSFDNVLQPRVLQTTM